MNVEENKPFITEVFDWTLLRYGLSSVHFAFLRFFRSFLANAETLYHKEPRTAIHIRSLILVPTKYRQDSTAE
jgi:hypothetical protein